MNRITIAEVHSHVGEQVVLAGWLYNLRKSGKLCFPIMRDGSGFIQCVAGKAELGDEMFDAVSHLTQESSLTATGNVREESRAPGGYEIDIVNLEIGQRISEFEPYPITPKEHGIGFLLDHRHLWLRSRRQHAALRVRHEIIRAIRDYLDSNGFTLVDAPVLTTIVSDPRTGFTAKFFDEGEVFLTQTGQMYNEAAAAAFGKAYSFGPVFNAVRSITRRDLAESWMAEPEMAFANLDDAANLAEALVTAVVYRVLENRREELKALERDVSALEALHGRFPYIGYTEAVKLLQTAGSEIKAGEDFSGVDQTLLVGDRKVPLLVHRYPPSLQPITIAQETDTALSLSFTMLAPEGYGEIVWGGERIRDLGLLRSRIATYSDGQGFKWYTDLLKYGAAPSAGFSLSLERVIGWVCGLEHVRETIPFPRMLGHVRP
ncbi:asparagine--tRNA ligase [Candidatus Berkelbacteria bacterium]|nr:asparagine--tRNA ligase [Candidatus Berkelbacteria bacterium]